MAAVTGPSGLDRALKQQIESSGREEQMEGDGAGVVREQLAAASSVLTTIARV